MPSVKSSLLSICIVFREYLMKSTYRSCIAYCLCTCCSLCMECLSLPSLPTFPEPVQIIHSIGALPRLPWHHSFLRFWQHFFPTSGIAINKLQNSLYNYLCVLAQLEASWTQCAYSSLHPLHTEQCLAQSRCWVTDC